MLQGKTVVLGVTGSIAAYKIANLASMLVKLHADVHVIMTQNATNFINPITFETLTSNKCLVDTFDRNFQYNVEHVSLAKKADVVLVAPASANVIAKLAHTEVPTDDVPNTCTEIGFTGGSHCSVCNAVIVAQQTVPAKGHSYEATVTAPTCTEDGYVIKACGCGATEKTTLTEAAVKARVCVA